MRLLSLLALAVLPFAAHAEIVIGQTAGFTGPVAASVAETTEGAKLYIDSINASGGINGQTLKLVSLDDKFDPPTAAANAQKLITTDNVLALFLTRGTPHNQAILPLLSANHIPLIAPSSGAALLHSPVNPWVFNVRATYQREAERAVRHLSLIGMERIGIVQVDDSFGADAVIGANAGLAAVNKAAAFSAKFDRAKPDFKAAAQSAVSSNAQAILFLGSGKAVADGIAAIRAAGSKAQIVTLSNNAAQGFVALLGENARGVIVTQVFPYERSKATKLVTEATQMSQAKGKGEITPAMMEGFAAAKVLVEGIRRAGPNPTRQKLRDTLEAMRKFDIGGLEVSFSPSDHSGLDFADLSMIGTDGKFMR
ncbi:ABC transporter substrate-binding protein [Roseateles amylovorans]|uniref:ABC transporter substrate-binding protein n=1 Tax=Roseateles amylovorans TaxID=2978473 RepID=A0ABY6B3W2_9BURK|nr:ABC transporter substrate-binding protein [Roseateles amylovorans]UXH80058.1 ABC transporter substrate-binding protein [Roseateles amylovorans]